VSKFKYVHLFERRSAIVLSGLVVLLIFVTKDLFLENTKDIASAIQSAKDGYENAMNHADLRYAVASNFFLLEVIKLRLDENAPDLGGHTYNRDLGDTVNIYGRNTTMLEKLVPLIELIPHNEELKAELVTRQNEVKVFGTKLGAAPPGPYTLQDLRNALDQERAQLGSKGVETEQFKDLVFEKANEWKRREEHTNLICKIIATVLIILSVVFTIGSEISQAKRIPVDPV
jgi:hypothetical protein